MGCLYKDIIWEREKSCPFSLILKERDKYRMVQLVEMDEEAEGELNISGRFRFFEKNRCLLDIWA
jgi:hypothetical protein